MADQVFVWIKKVALLNDESLKEEINLIHQSSLKAFARAIQRTTTETLTLQDGIPEQHPHAETINLLKGIGEQTISAINAKVPVSPIPYDVSPHMDLNTRIKVFTRRITIHLSEIPRGKGCSPAHLQIRQFIGQDLCGLERCFETQQAFNAYALQHFKWKGTMCSIYIAYYRFLVDYPMFVYSGLPWTRIRNDYAKWRRWLDSDAAQVLPTSDYTSSSFWKGTLPEYRETVGTYDESAQAFIGSLDPFDSDEEAINTQNSQMIISTSLAELDLQ
jgi:hypothetical protein